MVPLDGLTLGYMKAVISQGQSQEGASAGRVRDPQWLKEEQENSSEEKYLQFWGKLYARSSTAVFSEMFSVPAIGSDRVEVSTHAWINDIRKKDILRTGGSQNLYKRTSAEVKTEWDRSYFKNLLATTNLQTRT